MSKKKQVSVPQEDEIFDQMMFDHEDYEDDMFSTFAQVADASVEHMKVACKLTKLIVETHKNEKLSTQDILDIFRKSAETVLDSTPLKALFDKAE